MDGDKAVVILILVGLIISIIPALVASSKGREFFLWYIYGLFLFPFALIHAIVIKPNELANGMTKCRSCASVISEEAKICPSCRTILDGSEIEAINTTASRKQKESGFEGERDISSSSYQLFLTREYGIEKNATLEKYVIGNDVFTTLEESLREADRRYKLKLSDALEKEEAARRELTLMMKNAEIERTERSNQEARIRQEELEREAKLAPLKAAKRKKMHLVYALVAITCVGVGYVLVKQIEENKEKLLKTQEEEKEQKHLAEWKATVARAELIQQSRQTNLKLLGMYKKNNIFGFEIGAKNYLLLGDQIGTNYLYKFGVEYQVSVEKDQLAKLIADDGISSKIEKMSLRYCASAGDKVNLNDKSTLRHLKLVGVALVFHQKDDSRGLERMLREEMIGENSSQPKSIKLVDTSNGLILYRQGEVTKAFDLKNLCGNVMDHETSTYYKL